LAHNGFWQHIFLHDTCQEGVAVSSDRKAPRSSIERCSLLSSPLAMRGSLLGIPEDASACPPSAGGGGGDDSTAPHGSPSTAPPPPPLCPCSPRASASSSFVSRSRARLGGAGCSETGGEVQRPPALPPPPTQCPTPAEAEAAALAKHSGSQRHAPRRNRAVAAEADEAGGGGDVPNQQMKERA